jgi:acyl-CoA thioester hydrolase
MSGPLDPTARSERRRPPPVRADFVHFATVETRWSDNDVYGHVNNAVYCFYFDTVINRYLIDVGLLDIHASPVIAVTAETQARFVGSFAYPELLEAGLAVEHVGERSVRYRIGLFGHGEDTARVFGSFVHVFVERATMVPTNIPPVMRGALQRLSV